MDWHATAYLRADEAGISGGTDQEFVVWMGDQAAQYDTVDAGELLPGLVTVNGIQCKTAFELYADQVRSRTVAEWASICGIDAGPIETM